MNSGWLTLWTIVLVAALVLFTCLTVSVTIGGFVDIRKMIRQLKRQHRDSDSSPKT